MTVVRDAWRSITRHRAFAAGLIVSLGLAAAATTAMFALVNDLLLRPVRGVRAPQELFRIQADTGNPSASGRVDAGLSLAEFTILRDGVGSAAELLAYGTRDVELDLGGPSKFVPMQLVTKEYFQLLGVRPFVGRFFGSGSDGIEDVRSPAVVVVSRQFWERELSADPSVVGRPIRLNGVIYVVVAVAPAEFRGLDRRPPAGWIPAARFSDFGTPAAALTSRQFTWLTAFGRRPRDSGESLERVSAAIATVRRRDFDGTMLWSSRGLAVPRLFATEVPDVRTEGIVSPSVVAVGLLQLSLLLMVIACLNAGTLFVARGYSRREELATKLALGASPARLTRELLAECGLIAMLAVGTGLLLAQAASLVFGRLTAGTVDIVDWRVLGFAGVVMATTCIVATLLPVAVLIRPIRSRPLVAGRAATASGRSAPLRVALATQVALAFVLLYTAGLLIDTVSRSTELGLGVALDEMAMVSVVPVTDPRSREFLVAAKERLLKAPGIRGAALSSVAPLYGSLTTPISPPEGMAAGRMAVEVGGNAVEPGYFAAVGMRIVAGRDFDATDATGATVIIVNESLARMYWPGRTAVGQCLHTPRERPDRCPLTVIGVVNDAKLGTVTESPRPYIFSPLSQRPGLPVLLNVRTTRPATEMASVIRSGMGGVPAPAPIDIQPLSPLIDSQTAPWRHAAATLSVFALLAIAFSAFGIYSTTQLVVTARRREIAIRLAIGSSVRRMIAVLLAERLRDAATGSAVGLTVGLLLTQVLADSIQLLAEHAAGIAALAVVLLVVVALLSAFVAAWRVSLFHPAAILRSP